MSRNPSGESPKPTNIGKSGANRDAASGTEDRNPRHQIRDVSTAAFRKVEASAPPSVASRLRAFRERIRRHRSLDTAWRVMVFALGCTLLAAGLVMFVFPGPGFATVILALVVLGSEFTWANRALNPVKEAARRASEAAMDPRQRRRNLIAAAVAGVLVGVALVWYLLTYGLTIHPIMSLLQSVLDWVRGLFD